MSDVTVTTEMMVRPGRLAVWGALLPLLVAGCASPGPTAPRVAETVQVPAAKPVPTVQAAAVTQTLPAKPAQALPDPTPAEKQAGLQVTHIGVTAAGGLVDVRFKVLDATKVKALLGGQDAMPMLVIGDLPPLMAPQHGMKSASFADGRMIFLLYPNTRRAVQPGVDVTVAVGSVRLGPVKAQ